MAEGINVGDAVLTFFGDTTRLDQSFTKIKGEAATVGATIGTAIEPAAVATQQLGAEFDRTATQAEIAGAAMAEAGQKAKFSMSEAKGEARLLGEAMGVHLPRHVSGFLAALPGVGEALSAAFSATAVLFLIEALVQGTEKLSNFLAATFIFTESMKALDEVEKTVNKTFIEQADRMTKIRHEMELIGLHGKALDDMKLKQMAEGFQSAEGAVIGFGRQITEAEAKLERLKTGAESAGLSFKMLYLGPQGAAAAAIKDQEDIIIGLKAQEAAAKRVVQVNKEDLTVTDAQQRAGRLEAAQKDASTKMEHAAALAVRERFKAINELIGGLDKLEKAERDVQQAPPPEIVQPEFITRILAVNAAFKTLGVQGVGQLRDHVNELNAAYKVLQGTENKNVVSEHNLLQAKLALVKANILLAQSEGRSTKALEKEEKEIKSKLVPAIHQWGQVQSQVSAGITNAVGQAAAAYASGAATMGEALKQALQNLLSSLASEAMVQVIVETAKGFAAMSPMSPDFGHSGEHFTSAGIWAAVGGTAMAAGRAMGGSGSGSGAGTGAGAGSGAFTSSNPATGNFGTELVNPNTLSAAAAPAHSTGSAIMDQMLQGRSGGGTQVTIHVKGMISADNLGKVVKKVNKMVAGRQTHLMASNSYRVTRRSQ